MIALISDIHSNIEALQAVFEDMKTFAPDEIYCLGDVVGYGPDPRETLAMVKDAAVVLMGNHEDGLLYKAENFNSRARSALEWTREQLNSSEFDKEESFALWEFIDTFQKQETRGDLMFVHASPRQPVTEYVMPAHSLDRRMMADIFAHFEEARACFGGHTHVPGIFEEGRGFRHQSNVGERYTMGEHRCLVNIGSVGQPRDGDPRASYLLIDGADLLFRRVEYDVRTTMRKIAGIPSLDDFLAKRLKVGQ